MRVVVDLQGAQSPSNRDRGIGRYSLALTRALCLQRGGHNVVLALNGLFPETLEPLRAAFAGLLPQEAILVWDAVGPVQASEHANDARRRVAELARETFLASLRPDVVLDTSMFEGLGDDAVTSIGRRPGAPTTAVVLYDLIPLVHQEAYLADPGYARWYREKLDQLPRADLLLAISDATAEEATRLLELPSERVQSISTACDGRFVPMAITGPQRVHLREAYGLVRPFVLYAGGIDHRKNVEGLLRAYAAVPGAIRAEHQLAIVCAIQPAEQGRLRHLAGTLGLGPDELVLTGFVPDDDLVLLYNACKLFAFPSWHEGFGLPVLEAMACGRAVIGSNTTSIPEVIGRPDALFDPRDDGAITRKLVQVLTDDDFRAELERHGAGRARAFSWEETARRAWRALEALVARGPRPARPSAPRAPGRRPRLAYVSPLPPERSGIAEYSTELLPHLAEHYEIELVVARHERRDDGVRADFPVRDVSWFRANGGSFDRVLYHVGNSACHTHMFDLLHEVPGVVVLHDFYLSHLVRHLNDLTIRPHGWRRALLQAHGWPAVLANSGPAGEDEAVWTYPGNLEVLQAALGIVVHSDHARQMARRWYGPDAARDWTVIPLLRAPAPAPDRAGARRRLGLDAGDFVVSSFGILGPHKLNDRLLDAWAASPAGRDPRCRLVFVGESPAGTHSSDFLDRIRRTGLQDRVTITGWVDMETFRAHLAAADLAVQLRTRSRGETSATALDCMNYGVPTIVNAHGSMADLPADAVRRLPDDFSDEQLRDALTGLWRDEPGRRRLGERAREVIRTEHEPRHCARLYAEAVEGYHAQAAGGLPGLLDAVARVEPPLDSRDTPQLARALALDFPPSPRRPQLLLDVSMLVHRDAKSGIQRVVRSLLSEMLREPPEGWAVEPVFATSTAQGFRYARGFTSRFLGLTEEWIEDEPIDAWPGDVFLGLDLQQFVVNYQKDHLLALHRRGLKVHFVVYDLLPVLLPATFPEGGEVVHRAWLETISHFDGALCISRAVAAELADWQRTNATWRTRPFRIEAFHLGADIEGSVPTRGLPGEAGRVLDALARRPTFLMVGTLEPRKCHAQALGALELLWRNGTDINLAIVGNVGWLAGPLLDRLHRHPERDRRLFWLEGISDEYLERIYAASSCLVCASLGEGFGLPLVEAARHRLPIIARDLPVFREVAGPRAFYFRGTEPSALADGIAEWLALRARGEAPRSDDIPRLTWKESAAQLKRALLDHPGDPAER